MSIKCPNCGEEPKNPWIEGPPKGEGRWEIHVEDILKIDGSRNPSFSVLQQMTRGPFKILKHRRYDER